MASSPAMVARTTRPRHALSTDGLVKVNVQNLDTDWLRAIGAAIARAIAMANLTDKEVTAKVEQAAGQPLDASELGKWQTGERRPHLDRLFAVEELREPLVICLAALTNVAEIHTEIRFRRRA